MSLLIGFLGWSSAAQAAAPPAVQAEQARLQSEMQKLAARETWEGVEGLYQRLLALEPDGAELTYAEHLLGAQAARALGNVAATRARLLLALAQWDTELARDWLRDIDDNYGRVTILLHPRYKGPRELRIAQSPFEADRRFAITFAQDALAASGRFDGYLPSGDYTFDGESFSVAPGPPVTLSLLPDASQKPAGTEAASTKETPRTAAPETGLAWQGHLRLGGGYGGVGDPSVGGIEPTGFQGLGPLVAVGGGAVLGGKLRLRAEGGMWRTTREEDAVTLGYGSLLGGLRWGPLWLEGGPVYARGRGVLVGLDPAALQVYCAQADVACAYSSAEAPTTASVTGTLRMGGVGGGVSWLAVETGPVGWLLGGEAGGMTDGVRWSSWARLALTVQVGGNGS